jgi:hypothetical protein
LVRMYLVLLVDLLSPEPLRLLEPQCFPLVPLVLCYLLAL